MLFDIPRCSRICAATNRELKPGEVYYSLLYEKKETFLRLDYSQEGWPGPSGLPSELIGYWKSRIPTSGDKAFKLAPNDILLNFFDQLVDQPDEGQSDKSQLRYVLILLLIRRRLFRLEKEESDPQNGGHLMTVYCPKREASYSIPVLVPSGDRLEELQNTLVNLLFSD